MDVCRKNHVVWRFACDPDCKIRLGPLMNEVIYYCRVGTCIGFCKCPTTDPWLLQQVSIWTPLTSKDSSCITCRFLWMFDKHHPWNKPKFSWSKFYWQLVWWWHYIQITSPYWLPSHSNHCWQRKVARFLNIHICLGLLVLFSGALLVYGVTLVT